MNQVVPSPASSPSRLWIGFGLSLLAVIFFSYWTWLVFAGSALPGWDRECAEAMQRFALTHDLLRRVMVTFTFLGSTPVLVVIAGAGAVAALARRRLDLVVAWALIVPGGALVNFTLKVSLDHPRPEPELRDPAVYETTASYPSGHSMGSVVGLGMYAYVAVRGLRSRR